MAVPMGSSAESQRWSGLEVSNVSLLRFAWQAWHFVSFRRVCNVLKVVLCGTRNTFATFSDDVWQLSWQAQHFGRVVLSVFCKSHWQGCVKWRQGANSVAGVAFCDMCCKLTEASHETSILRLQNLELGHLFSQLLLR